MLVEESEEPHPTVGGGDRLEAVRTVADERMAVVRIEDDVVCMVCRHRRDVLGRDVLVRSANIKSAGQRSSPSSDTKLP